MAQPANLIAEIESKGEKKKGDNVAVVVDLKEANGRTFQWTSWHKNSFNEYSVGDVIEIVPDLKPNPNGKYPFRNVREVLGKRERSQMNTLDITSFNSAGSAQPNVSASSNGLSDHAKAVERRSIERQSSVNMVIRLLEGVCSIDDLDQTIDAVLKAAERIEVHYARQGALAGLQQTVTVPDPENYGQFVQKPVTNGKRSEPATDDPYVPPQMVSAGDLFTAAMKRYKKNRTAVLEVFEVSDVDDLLNKVTPEEAWDQLQALWEGPPEPTE